jgi:hypothetical protein
MGVKRAPSNPNVRGDKFRQNSLLVLNDNHTLRLNRDLAKEIGRNQSIVFLQLDFLIAVSNHVIDGRRWTYQSITDLEESFPFWKRSTINRAILSLVEQGLITVSNFNKAKYDKTRWFSINLEAVLKLKSVSVKEESTLEIGSTQNETGSTQNESRKTQDGTTIPKTTSKTTPEITTERESKIAAAISPARTQPILEDSEKNVTGMEGRSSITNIDSHREVAIDGEFVKYGEEPASAGNGISTLLPADFHVSDTMQAWAAANVPGVDIKLATMKYVIKRREEGRKSKNWEEDWRGYLISWANNERHNKSGSGRALSSSERRVETYRNRNYDEILDGN